MKDCSKLTRKFISIKRYEHYDNIYEYKQNILKAKKMYIPLSIVEVSLKNSINDFYTDKVGIDWIFNNTFLPIDLQKKVTIASKTLSQKKKSITKDNVVAELSFGFWTMLLKKYFQEYLRYRDLKIIFPNIQNTAERKINRHYLFTKLNHIRTYRNKVFHYDKIIGKVKYKNIENDIYEVLNYFDAKMISIVEELNI